MTGHETAHPVYGLGGLSPQKAACLANRQTGRKTLKWKSNRQFFGLSAGSGCQADEKGYCSIT